MEMLRHLWDEAASIDETAGAKHEGNMPLCREGELATLWADGGLTNVNEDGLVIQMNFASFDDYWSPFLTKYWAFRFLRRQLGRLNSNRAQGPVAR
jgi:hypothetical protein